MFSNYPDYLTYSYGLENLENSSFFPSTAHASDNNLTAFNFRYLFQRAMSVFDFKIPSRWARNFFLRTLYGVGYVIIVPTDEYGVIPQFGNIWGFDVFYQPAFASVVNPVFDEKNISEKYAEMRIGEKCEILHLTPDYAGITSICRYYAEMLATAQASLQVNLLNTKFSYIFGVKDKASSETMKRLYDDIASGQSAVFVDKDLYDENGNLSITTLTQDVSAVYIGGNLLNDIRGIMNDFDSLIGIPNSNLQKKERMIVDEANMNNFETRALCYLWKDMLDRDIKIINGKYGLDLKVDWRKGVNGRDQTDDYNFDTVPAES